MRVFILNLFFILSVAASASAQDLLIAISPHVSEQERQSQGEAVVRFLAEHVAPGRSAEIINAYDLSPIATFTVPDNRAYQNPRAKVTANRAAIAAILRLEPQSQRAATAIAYPLDLPGLLRFVGNAYALDSETDLIILGSPLYDMPAEAHVSMTTGGVPGDGLIRATRGTSPFGAGDVRVELEGLRVHFAAIDPDWALHDRHAFAVERFTTLLVEAYGAEMVSFSNDVDTVFNQVRRGAEARPNGFVLEETDKRQILFFRPNTAPRAIGRDANGERASYTGPSNVDGPVEIALFWPCQTCDLDLHVEAHPGAARLSYRNRETSEGQFYKDIRTGPADDRSLETIDLHGPVDLTTLSIWINAYGANAPNGVEVELRITIDGRTYARPLRLEATVGDFGAGREGVIENGATDPAWIAIDPLALLRH
ncbi:MAG: hypothetical protein ACJA0K_000668 [Maricaulis maris]|jgi:hypothetical protein